MSACRTALSLLSKVVRKLPRDVADHADCARKIGDVVVGAMLRQWGGVAQLWSVKGKQKGLRNAIGS